MKINLQAIKDHIFRSWKEEPGHIHPALKIMPPFFYDLLIIMILGVLLFSLLQYLYFLIAK